MFNGLLFVGGSTNGGFIMIMLLMTYYLDTVHAAPALQIGGSVEMGKAPS
jgi:hypothetical protein